MPFDILLIIDNIKKFLKDENGTILSLFVFLLIEFLIYNYIFGQVILRDPTIHYIRTYVYLAILTSVIWFVSRRIRTSGKKTNIGLSKFEIVDIDYKNPIPGDVRYNLSEELDYYIHNRIMMDNRSMHLDYYLKIILLPTRLSINRDHPFSESHYKFLDFIISGVIYFENGKLFLTPNVGFIYDLPIKLFVHIKENFLTEKRFEYLTDGSPNLPLDKMMHQVTYIGLIYAAAKLAHRQEFVTANELLNDIGNNITKLYASDDKSVEAGDVDFVTIEALSYFLRAKALHKYGNSLLFDGGDVDAAKEKFVAASQSLLKTTDLLHALAAQDPTITDETIYDHSYIYAIGLLAKAQDKQTADKIIDDLGKSGVSAENTLLANALLAEREDKQGSAQKEYEQIVAEHPENKYALRRLSSIYFRSHKFDDTYKVTTSLYQITTRHVYDDEYYDLRTVRRYVTAALLSGHVLSFADYTVRLPFYGFHNLLESRKRTNF